MLDFRDFELTAFTLAQNNDGGPPVDIEDLQPDAGEPGEAVEGENGQDPAAAPPEEAPGLGPVFWGLILLVIVFWIFIFGGQRKERKRQQQMIGSLQKNDKVRTSGGILGTVVEVREEEIILKVDESTNTRLRVAKNAIQNVESSES